MWWALALVGGAAILGASLYSTTSDARERWNSKRDDLEKSIYECEKIVNEAISESIEELDYKTLIDIHFSSMRVANEAYRLRNDVRTILNSHKETLTKLKQCRDKIYPLMKDNSITFEERGKYREEFDSYGMLRQGIFEEFETLKLQHSLFNEKLHKFNMTTHKLKISIRDNCGWRGEEWFERLEARTKARRGS